VPDSSIGWGHNPFGSHQFGFGDWAEEMLWKAIPETYRDCDEEGPTGSSVQQPLRKFQSALKPSYQDLRIKWHQFLTLWDAIRVPLDQLPQLAYNVGITVDPTKSEGLQRSSVLNASTLWVNKGTDKGYDITAAFEGLLVTTTPLWAQTCGPADHVLSTIGELATPFDLSTTLLNPRPIGPGTLHINVTTKYGISEQISDDELGSLFGTGNQQNGPLTRIDITPTTTLSLTSIVGLFGVGNTVTQGATTGTIIAIGASSINVVTTAGVFGTGAILDTTSLATATVTITSPDVIAAGDTFVGETSGTTAVLRDFKTSFMIIDRITTLAGFTPGEVLRCLTGSGRAIAGITTQLVPGPLRARLTLSAIVGAFIADDEVTGGTSTSVGLVGSVSGSAINVELITLPGFSVGETITSGANSATIDAISYGTIDYIGGSMVGETVPLLAGSTVNFVVELLTAGPTQFLASYDEVSADLLPIDLIKTDRYEEWPDTLRPVRIRGGIITDGECRSHSLRLFFFTPDNTEIENFTDVAARVLLALESFRPIHVEFDKISFDGARASSQVWRIAGVNADSSAAAVWSASVVGNQLATSQVWTTGPVSADVAV